MIFLTVPEVAALLGINQASVYDACSKGKIPSELDRSVRRGKPQWRIPADAFLLFLEEDIKRQEVNHNQKVSKFREAIEEVKRRMNG